MKDSKVKDFIDEKIEQSKKWYPKQIYKGLQVDVYNCSFGSISIRVCSEYGIASGYVANYEAVDEKINQFLHCASYNLYERYWRKHHKQS